MNNFDMMSKRLEYLGGVDQQPRMIKEKYRSLLSALNNSYQSAVVCREGEEKICDIKALINPNRLNQDYDDKIISIPFEEEYKVGDVFEWVGTNSYWLIYNQLLTELAYFCGNIRKCSHIVSWKDESGAVLSMRAAVIRPKGSDDEIKRGVVSILALPGESITLMIPYNNTIKEVFQRNQKFMLGGEAWKVQTVSNLSEPKILHVYATKNYQNEQRDTSEVIDGLVIEPVDPNPAPPQLDPYISGNTFIKPLVFYVYTLEQSFSFDSWTIKEENKPIVIEKINDFSIKLKWTSSVSGNFTLLNGAEIEKKIIVQSLF